MEYIITFKNTNFAIKAEQWLLEQRLQVGVLPLPSQISAGCGISLRIGQNEIKSALAVLAEVQITDIGLYSKIAEDGRYSYNEIADRGLL